MFARDAYFRHHHLYCRLLSFLVVSFDQAAMQELSSETLLDLAPYGPHRYFVG